jgi:peptidylprolyl isomerase
VRLRRSRALALLAVPALLLAGCGADSADAGSPALKPVEVTGKVGEKPTVKVDGPLDLTATSTRVVTAGTGAAVREGQKVVADFLVVNGRDGKELETSFGKAPQLFTADPEKVLPGLAKAMIGEKTGTRILVGVPPEDAFGKEGNSQLGVGAEDTLLFVLDLRLVPLEKADGAAVAPKAGLPAVEVDDAGASTITVPKTAAPTALVTQPLVTGDGPVVEKGQTLWAHYTGVVWKTGKKFDSSHDRGEPAGFPIGVGQVIPGWDRALVGQKVGSRVLLAIPPALGYGAQGQPEAGIGGTDTLVFVVDILGAT